MSRVTKVKKSRDGRVCSCVIKSLTSQIVRPVTKLCLLESSIFNEILITLIVNYKDISNNKFMKFLGNFVVGTVRTVVSS